MIKDDNLTAEDIDEITVVAETFICRLPRPSSEIVDSECDGTKK